MIKQILIKRNMNIRLFLLIYFLCATLISSISHAQEKRYKFDHLNVEHGLSQSTVNYILKDSQGYIWFATNDGLNRYDGYEFTVYRHNPLDTTSLNDNKVYCIREDAKRNLWIGTPSGLNRYIRKYDRFQRIPSQTTEKKLDNLFVRTILIDSKQRIWIGSFGSGLSRYDTTINRFILYNPEINGKQVENNNLQNVFSIIEDRKHTLWFGALSKGIYKFSPETNEAIFFPFDKQEVPNSNAAYGKSLYESLDGNLWVCSEGDGIYRMNNQSNTFQHYEYETGKNSLSNNIVKDILEVQPGIFWIATDGGGINIFNEKNQSFSYLKYDITNQNSLSSNAIYTIYKDNNIYWIGTFGGGVSIFDGNKKRFVHHTQNSHNPNGLSHKAVLSFCEAQNGKIWIGTDGGGLNLFNPKTNRYKHYKNEINNPYSISSNVITSIVKDSKAGIWIGTYLGGLNYFDKKKQRFIHYKNNPNDSNSLINNNVWTIIEDKDNNLWIGTLGGLELFDRKNKKFIHYNYKDEEETFYKYRVTTLLEDSKGTIWIGGKGLRILDKENKCIVPLKKGKEENLQNYDIRALFEDTKNNVWIGTEGGGLYKYNRTNNSFKSYTTQNGLPNDAIHEILEDKNGNLWISTNHGISKLNPTKETFRNYDVNDGLQSNQFSYSAALKASDGRMFFGGINGFNTFFPDSIKDNPFKPPIVITNLTILNKPIKIGAEGSPLQKHISETDKITLTHEQSVFTLEFKALNYTSPQKNKYAIKLEGFDKEWIDYGERRFVSYTNLPPGKYIFKVKGSNNDGVWNREGTSLNIEILPPYWKTLWAYLIYIFILAVMLLSFRRFLLARTQLKNDLKIKDLEKRKIEEVNQLKLRFYTNVSHEFKTPLTLIVGPIEKLLQNEKNNNFVKKQYELINRNAERLLRLINQLMDFRKIETGNMTLLASKNNIVDFLRQIKTAFNDFAERHNIKFEFITDTQVAELWFDTDKLEKVFYNLLSNAFKFTHDYGKITIRLKTNNDESSKSGIRLKNKKNTAKYVTIEVEDTGQGISRERLPKIFDRFYQIQSNSLKTNLEQQGTGIGLALTKSLVELHRGNIEVKSKTGIGTCFTINLPLGNKHLNSSETIKKTDNRQYSRQSDISLFLKELDTDTNTDIDIKTEEEGFENETRDALPKILIVEDNADLRAFLRQCLEKKYQVLDAENGKIALEAARTENPDLIISDIMMPEMDGIQFCKEVKQDIEISHIPIILLTALSAEEYKLKGYDTGADDYITKPFNSKILEIRIKNLIEAKKLIYDKIKKDVILQPKDVTLTSTDEIFLKKAVSIVEEQISNSDFDVKQFVSEMGVSRSVLYRKLRAVTDQSANEFIRLIRLKRAAQLLVQNQITIAEVSYSVGFNDPQYFSKCFKKHYAMTPSEYAEKNTIRNN